MTSECYSMTEERLHADKVVSVLRDLPSWGDLVTIVLHGGCVFEYKGPFPAGEIGKGFYNLKGTRPGFEGHINLKAIDHIAFQVRKHAGRVAYALNFNDKEEANLFKVFLGRNGAGEIYPDQKYRFDLLMTSSRLGGAPRHEQ